MTRAQVLDWLKAHAEPDYGLFAASLIPGVSDVLGVRLPVLRQLARQLAQQGAQEALESIPETPFEARMLRGYVIGYAKTDLVQRWKWVEAFLPVIDNWSICDSFCATLASRLTEEELRTIWPQIRMFAQSDAPFVARFAIVMMIDAYMRPEYIDCMLAVLSDVRCDAYYVRMAVAWALATALGEFAEQTRCFLGNSAIHPWVRQKMAQKACESRRVSLEDKQWVRTWAKKAHI